MTRPRLCFCGHARGVHPTVPVMTVDGVTKLWCLGGEVGCICDGWTEAARVGDRLVFGQSRIPKAAAESAPAWRWPEPDPEP